MILSSVSAWSSIACQAVSLLFLNRQPPLVPASLLRSADVHELENSAMINPGINCNIGMITRAPLAALLLHLPKKRRAPKISYTTNDSGRLLWKQSQTEHNDCLQLGTHSLFDCGGSSQLTTHEVKLSNKGETRLGTDCSRHTA